MIDPTLIEVGALCVMGLPVLVMEWEKREDRWAHLDAVRREIRSREDGSR